MSADAMPIASLAVDSSNLTIECIVLQKLASEDAVRDGSVRRRKFLVADASGSVELCVEGGELIDAVQPGDILLLRRAHCKAFKRRMVLFIAKNGYVRRTGDFCLLFSEQPNMSARQLPAKR